MDEQKPSWTFQSDTAEHNSEQAGTSSGSIQWTASEYIDHDKNNLWYVALMGAGTAVAVIVYLITQELLPTASILIASILMAVVAARKPASKEYSLSPSILQIGQSRFHLNDFRSFSIIEEGAIDGIWLKPLARFKPMIVIYFAPEDEEKIVDMLSGSLPHEQRELDPFDRISRRLRF